MKEKRRVWVLAIATLLCSFSLGAGVLAMAEENPVYSFDDFSSDCTKSGVTFSTFGQNASPRITQTSDIAVTQDTETHNQETTVEYNNPIFIGDNGVDTPFITYSIDPQGWGQRDMDAIIFTLYDENDPTQYVSVMQLFAAPNVANSSLFYAKGTGQVYQGYHSSGDVYSAGKLLGLNQGTISNAALYQDNESNSTKTVSQFINLYYDNETKAVYTDYYWASYNSRTIPNATNASGAKLVMIRDLDDEAYLNGDKAYAPDIKTAKLKITTVRGWYDYTDEFGEKNTSNIYSSQFYGGSADAHTLSDKGARYLLRAIDGTSLKFTGTNNAIESVGETKYFAASMESGRDVEIPALKGLNLFLGYSDGTEYTKTTYVKVTDSQNSSVTLTGLNEGKWTEDCGFTAETEGVYTLYYYVDAEMTDEVAKTQITVKNVTPDMENLVYNSDPLDLFSSQTVGISQGAFKVNNSANYSGVILSATGDRSSVEYGKEIDISDNTKTVPLMEFLPLPQTVGVGEVRILVFKFYEKDNPENYFSVKFQHDSNITGCDIMTAAGNNQDYYGLKLIRDKDEYNNGLLAQKLDGGAAVSSYQPIGIYYDKSENCVYVSPTWDHTQSSSVGISKLRDFDDDLNLKLQSGNTVTQPAWKGFSGNEIVIEISFDTVVSGSTAKIGVISVDGETFEKRLEGEAVAKGIVGYDYPIPEPIYYNAVAGDYRNFFESYSAVKVYDPTGAEVSVTDKNIFTPSTAGIYTIVYGVLEEETSFGYNLKVEILSEADAGDIAFDFSQASVRDGMEVFLGEKLSAVVTATSELYLKEDKACGVTAELYRDGTLVQTFEAGEAVEISCDILGDYRIVYAATDYVGRTQKKAVSFSVVRTFMSFVDPDQKESVMDRTNETPVVSEADITVKDVYKNEGVDVVVESADFYSFETQITISYNGGALVEYTGNYDFSALGTYIIQYCISYQLVEDRATYTAETQRTLTVVDNTAPVFGKESVITGIKKNEGKTDLGAVWYKAITGSSITLGQEHATDPRKDGAVEVENLTAVVTDADGVTTDITGLFVNGTYTFTAGKAGVYYVKFTANDGSLSTSKTYVIEVKELWLDVTVTETPEDAEYGVEYSLPQITATNYEGENITSSVALKVEIVSGGAQSKEVQNYRWTPDVVDEVVIRYTVTMGNETVVLERTLKVKDNEAPVITLDGEPAEKGSAGSMYVLPTIAITDNADPFISYRIYLVFDGTEKELYDPSFIPEDEGEYTIRIECEDFSGNMATKEIKVQVGERQEVMEPEPSNNGWIVALSVGIGVGVVILGVLVTVIILKKKKEVK